MGYVVNGVPMTRNELVENVLKAVLELESEKAPAMAYRPLYTVEHNVNRHACKIARAMGWSVKVA